MNKLWSSLVYPHAQIVLGNVVYRVEKADTKKAVLTVVDEDQLDDVLSQLALPDEFYIEKVGFRASKVKLELTIEPLEPDLWSGPAIQVVEEKPLGPFFDYQKEEAPL